MGQRDRDLSGFRSDIGRSRSGRTAAQDSRFFAAFPELRILVIGHADRADRAVSHQDRKARARGKDHAMTMFDSQKDRRALLVLGAGLALALAIYYGFPSKSGTPGIATTNVSRDNVNLAQQR